MHEDETYARHKELFDEKRLEENEASEREIAATTKSCPECGLRVEKEGGCDHMTCMLIYHLLR